MAGKKKKPVASRGVLGTLVVGLVRFVWRVSLWVGVRVGAVAVVVIAGTTLWVHAQLPPLEELLDGRERGSVTMQDRNGDVFAWRGEQGGVMPAHAMSRHLVNAVVAVEDRRFFRHFGISPRGIASAVRINLSEGRGPLTGNGGSTITQQTAKLVFLGAERSIARKLWEVPYSFAMELKYDKDEILSIYMNRAYLGAGTNGFDAAARRYFGKSAQTVTPAEAAMLAGLLKAPSRFSPTSDLDRARDRASLVLRLMYQQDYLTPEEYAAAQANPAGLSSAATARAGGAFADWIMESAPDFMTSTREDLVVRTTFDPAVQEAAVSAIDSVFEDLVREGSNAQAAIVVMGRDGAVRAMVGGRDTGPVAGQFNRATQALRQPGSAFKPLVYAAGLRAGLNPTDVMTDEPITINVPGSGPWSPQNYSREYRGPMDIAQAFARSTNTVAVGVHQLAGNVGVQQVARDLGWTTPLAEGPSLALGVSETTLLTLTNAYSTFLAEGRFTEAWGLLDVRYQGEDRPALSAGAHEGSQVLDPQIARQVTWMMRQVIDAPWGTGRRAQLGARPAAGKTGTTTAARDAWFIGFTGDYVAGVWMGYDDNTPLTGVTGGGLPAEIWRRTMENAHRGLPSSPLPQWTAPAGAEAGVALRREVPYPGGGGRRARDAGETVQTLVEGFLRGIFGQ